MRCSWDPVERCETPRFAARAVGDCSQETVTYAMRAWPKDDWRVNVGFDFEREVVMDRGYRRSKLKKARKFSHVRMILIRGTGFRKRGVDILQGMMWRFFASDMPRDLDDGLAALTRILPVRQRLGKKTTGEQVLQIPLWSGLGNPGPEEPSGMLLIGIKLGLDEVPEVILVVRAQSADAAGIFAIAAAHDVAACQSAIVASTFAKSVQPLRAVRLCACPFADDSPFVGACEFGTKRAGGRDVVRRAHGDLVRAEDLVLVCVEHVVFRTCREAIPDGYKVLESVMETDDSIGLTVTDGHVALVVEVLDAVEI